MQGCTLAVVKVLPKHSFNEGGSRVLRSSQPIELDKHLAGQCYRSLLLHPTIVLPISYRPAVTSAGRILEMSQVPGGGTRIAAWEESSSSAQRDIRSETRQSSGEGFAILTLPRCSTSIQGCACIRSVCGSGEIGRHTILRGWRRKAWGFKSPLPHQNVLLLFPQLPLPNVKN
jgi:hypothetical protein